MAKDNAIPTILSAPRRRRAFHVRVGVYALVMALVLFWYHRAGRRGHVEPLRLQVRELRESVELVDSPCEKLVLLDQIIENSRHRPEFEYRDALAWAMLRKADLTADSREKARLLENVVDANMGSRDLGLRMRANTAFQRRTGMSGTNGSLTFETTEFIEKYGGLPTTPIFDSLVNAWRSKVEAAKGGDKITLLSEYRRWLESRKDVGQDVHLAWVLGQLGVNGESPAVRLAYFNELISRFSNSANEDILVSVVWSLEWKAHLLREHDARLAVYDEADSRYGDHPSTRVRLQVAKILKARAELHTGRERGLWYDEILSRYSESESKPFAEFLQRIAKDRAALNNG